MVTFSDRLATAFKSPKQPAGFEELCTEILAICEPLAAPQFALKIANPRYGGPRCVGDYVRLMWWSLWGKPAARTEAQDYMLSLGRVADGLESFDESEVA